MTGRRQEAGGRNQEEGKQWEARTVRGLQFAVRKFERQIDSGLRLCVLGSVSAPDSRLPTPNLVPDPNCEPRTANSELPLSVILAAHGSRQEEEANRIVLQHAQRLRDEFGFPAVRTAFWQGKPGLDEVLDETAGTDSVVVPFFTAHGHYSSTVLPRELARNRSFDSGRLRMTAPLGTRPEMEQLAVQRVRRLLRRWNWPTHRTGLLVVGHGTRRNPSSRLTTVALADRLREWRVCGQVSAAFLDEPPYIEEALQRISEPNVLLLPFLIGGSAHSLRDIPRRAGLTVSGFDSLPFTATVGPRRVACDQALGSDPAMPWVISRMVREEIAGSHRDTEGTEF